MLGNGEHDERDSVAGCVARRFVTPRVGDEAEGRGHEPGGELTIGGAAYRVIYAVDATRDGERQVLVVESLRGERLYYRVIVGEDGGLSAPALIRE